MSKQLKFDPQKKEIILAALTRLFPSGLAPRSRIDETGFIAKQTLANADTNQSGPEGRLLINGRVVYENEGLADWLACR